MTPAPSCLPQIRRYQDWLSHNRGLAFDCYDDLWRWSTTDLSGLWQSLWDHFDLQSPSAYSPVCDGVPMPHTQWFTGAQANQAQPVLPPSSATTKKARARRRRVN